MKPPGGRGTDQGLLYPNQGGQRSGKPWGTHSVSPPDGGLHRSDRRGRSLTVLPALPQPIQSDRAVLGHSGTTLERESVGQHDHDAGMGKEHDVEGGQTGGHTRPESLPEGGCSLSRKAMRDVEARLERNPLLPKWDILIRPA